MKKQQGVITEGRILKGLFGNDLFMKAQTEQTNFIETLRESTQLGVNKTSGILSSVGTAATTAIKSNTFFG